jgi:DNA-directed RNA polymerase subunit E'/Rpb7
MEEGNIVSLSPDDFTKEIVYGTIVHVKKESIIVEFSPYSAIYTVIEWTKARKSTSMIHFPGLLISVLPMLENIQCLYRKENGVYFVCASTKFQVETKLFGNSCKCTTTAKKAVSIFK